MEKTSKSSNVKKLLMPLNRYLAHAGLCSRRKAVEYIQQGFVKVNDTLIREPGYKVTHEDTVTFKNKLVRVEKKIYLLLNKPRGYVTTVSDEKGRKTVVDLVKGAIKERIYPVGRLDRATTGLLLLTNDGDLAQKLAHPKYKVKKIYSVVLDRVLKQSDIGKIKKGVKLEDGIIAADKVVFAPEKSKNNVIIQIHSGKNRVIRRMFKQLDYNVVKLDRINFAGLTKRGVALSRWRELTKHEINCLKQFGEIKRKPRGK